MALEGATINLWAILVAAVVAHFMGALWYSPLLFGNMWMRAVGIKKGDIAKAKKEGMAKSYLGMFAASLVMAYVLANIIGYGEARDWVSGMGIGFWMWLGFMATAGLGPVLFTKKTWTAYCIDEGYHLAMMLAAGAILAVGI